MIVQRFAVVCTFVISALGSRPLEFRALYSNITSTSISLTTTSLASSVSGTSSTLVTRSSALHSDAKSGLTASTDVQISHTTTSAPTLLSTPGLSGFTTIPSIETSLGSDSGTRKSDAGVESATKHGNASSSASFSSISGGGNEGLASSKTLSLSYTGTNANASILGSTTTAWFTQTELSSNDGITTLTTTVGPTASASSLKAGSGGINDTRSTSGSDTINTSLLAYSSQSIRTFSDNTTTADGSSPPRNTTSSASSSIESKSSSSIVRTSLANLSSAARPGATSIYNISTVASNTTSALSSVEAVYPSTNSTLVQSATSASQGFSLTTASVSRGTGLGFSNSTSYVVGTGTGSFPITAGGSPLSNLSQICAKQYLDYIATYQTILLTSTETDYQGYYGTGSLSSVVVSQSYWTTTYTYGELNQFAYASGGAKPPCCNSCLMTAGTVQLYYWPELATATGHPSQSANMTSGPVTAVAANGFVFTSPSVYIAFSSLYGENYCGTVGNVWYDTTLAFNPDEISTNGGEIPVSTSFWTDDYGLESQVIYTHPPASALQYSDLARNCSTISGYVWFADDPQNELLNKDLCHPLLELPPSLLAKQDAWINAGCKLREDRGAYDPPIALTPVSTVAGPSTPAPQPGSSQTPVTPSATTIYTALPVTDSSVAANSPSKISSSKTSAISDPRAPPTSVAPSSGNSPSSPSDHQSTAHSTTKNAASNTSPAAPAAPGSSAAGTAKGQKPSTTPTSASETTFTIGGGSGISGTSKVSGDGGNGQTSRTSQASSVVVVSPVVSNGQTHGVSTTIPAAQTEQTQTIGPGATSPPAGSSIVVISQITSNGQTLGVTTRIPAPQSEQTQTLGQSETTQTIGQAADPGSSSAETLTVVQHSTNSAGQVQTGTFTTKIVVSSGASQTIAAAGGGASGNGGGGSSLTVLQQTTLANGQATAVTTVIPNPAGAVTPRPDTTPAAVLTLGGSTFTADSSSQFVISGTTLSAGQTSTVLISGTPVVILPGGSSAIVGSSTVALVPTQPAAVLTMDGSTFTADSSSVFTIDGTTLSAVQATSVNIGGTPVVILPGGSAVVGSSTEALVPSAPAEVLTVAGSTFTATSGTFVIDGTTLAAAGQTTYTIDGTPVVVLPGGSPAVVGSFTVALVATQPALLSVVGTVYTENAFGQFVADGTTLATGSQYTIDGTPVSILPGGLSAVVGSTTEALAHAQATGDPSITVGNEILTADPSGGYIVAAGTTLSVGGSSVVVGGTAYALKTDSTGHTLLIHTTPSTAGDPTITVGNELITEGPSGAYVVGPGATLSVGGPSVVIDGTAYALKTNSAGATILIAGTATSTLHSGASITIGDHLITPGPSGAYVLGPGETLSVGGPSIVVDGVAYALKTNGAGQSILVAGTATSTINAGASITVGGHVVTQGPLGAYILGPGQTLSVGGPSIIVDGVAYALKTDNAGQTLLVAGTATSTLGIGATITVAGHIFTAGPSGSYIFGPGQTLWIGGPSITEDGTAYALKTNSAGETVLVAGAAYPTAGSGDNLAGYIMSLIGVIGDDQADTASTAMTTTGSASTVGTAAASSSSRGDATKGELSALMLVACAAVCLLGCLW